MEVLERKITELTGAINMLVARVDRAEQKITTIDTRSQVQSIGVTTEKDATPALVAPRNEEDLKSIYKLPDAVKELQVFDGEPAHYVSWIHSVETILKDYDIVKNKPIYRAILQSVRGKIRGKADAALVSYNIFDDSWESIKSCLSLHYADKRDIQTLEHQLGQLSQKGMKIDAFYATVNHQFSLIINKIKTETYSAETMDALMTTYRNRALDVFIRGLDGDLSRLLTIHRPKTLPEAYSICLDIQNLNYRQHAVHGPSASNRITVPNNQIFSSVPTFRSHTAHAFVKSPQFSRFHNRTQQSFNEPNSFQARLPPRPPKPLERMEVDPSIQTQRVNYMNRPQGNNPFKRKADMVNFPQGGNQHPNKQQRIYHLDVPEEIVDENSVQQETQKESAHESANYDDSSGENFMEGASLAFHI